MKNVLRLSFLASALAVAQVCAFTQVRQAWVALEQVANSFTKFAPVLATDSAGNVFVAGAAETPAHPGSFDYLLIKYSVDGKRQWDLRFRAPGENAATAITVDGADNVYVTGRVMSNPAKNLGSIVTLKADTNGKALWWDAYEIPDKPLPQPNAIAVDNSGNVWVVGQTASGLTNIKGSDWIVIRYDSSGRRQWVKIHDGDEHFDDRAQAVVLDSSGCAYVTGSTNGLGNTGASVLTMKYAPDGTELWLEGRIETAAVQPNDDTLTSVWGYAIALDQAGDVVIGASGEFDRFDGEVGFYLTFKYNSSGELQWKTDPDEVGGWPAAMAVGANGNIYVTGTMLMSSGTISDILTVAYDSSGRRFWRTLYNPPNAPFSNGDSASAIALDAAGNVYVVGDTDFEYFVTLKYDSAGRPAWNARGRGPVVTQPSAVVVDRSGDVLVTGRVGPYYATVKYSERPQ